jgi:4-hydroxy-tetrahydrodipicolinate synthase
MSIREHIAAVEFCVRHVNHRVKVVAGAGSNDTSAAVYLSHHAEDSGADALLHVTPYYNKASQAGLIKHYEYIADRVELPIILYNVPSRTGVSFTAETYKALSENPRINGVKEASGNFSLLAHTRYLCGDDFYIWSGNDDQVVPMMSLGAKGVISVAANIVPEVMVRMTHLCLEGNFMEASKLQIEYMEFIDALFIEVNPIPIKAALQLKGYETGGLRLPLCDITDAHLEVLKKSMKRVGLL